MHKQRLLRTPLIAAIGLLAFLVAPSIASAHHIGATASCELVGNVPTVKYRVDFIGFSSARQADDQGHGQGRRRHRQAGAALDDRVEHRTGHAVRHGSRHRRTDALRQGGVPVEGQRQLGVGHRHEDDREMPHPCGAGDPARQDRRGHGRRRLDVHVLVQGHEHRQRDADQRRPDRRPLPVHAHPRGAQPGRSDVRQGRRVVLHLHGHRSGGPGAGGQRRDGVW